MRVCLAVKGFFDISDSVFLNDGVVYLVGDPKYLSKGSIEKFVDFVDERVFK